MSRTNRVTNLGAIGLSQNEQAASWGFVYLNSTVKDGRRWVGDEVTVPGLGKFVYSKSAAACLPGQACEFTDTGYVAITTFATSWAIGATTITVPAATHAALTEDELCGGFAIIYDGTTNAVQFRQIIGNDSSILNVAFNIRIGGPLTEAIVSGVSKIEVFANPYSALQTATSTTLAKAGIPASKVSAASTYFWTQISGFNWAAPQTNVGTRGGMGCFWRHDGSLESANTALAVTTATYDLSQYAGHCVAGTAAGNGPLFKLQG
jgi:hypothetical protein